jgi:dTDP-glucose 4,6-dehydratase
MTILVTGGAGFIGANLVHRLLTLGSARVVVLDKLTYAGGLHNFSGLAQTRVELVQADITDAQAVTAALRYYRPTWIIHCAAETHADRSIEGPRPFIMTNVVGTFELLEAVRVYLAAGHADPGAFRFLHVSTDKVYGSVEATGGCSETSPYAPRSPYAASKAAADHLVRAYCETYGFPALIAHSSNNYGPYQFPEKLVPLMILNALEGRPLPLYGDGTQCRDWLFVEDHCRALVALLQHGRLGEHYNIGGGQEHTNEQLVDRLCGLMEEILPASANTALADRDIRQYAELKTFVPDRPGHARRSAMETGKIQREVGWIPSTDLETGLRRTVQWYLTNRVWCPAVQSGGYRRERLGLVRVEGMP